MAQPTIGADFHEPLDIHRDRFAQISFDHSISLDDVSNAHRFVFGQVFHLGVEIDAGLFTDLGRPAFADPVDVSQTDLNSLTQRQIHSCDSSQFLPPFLGLTICD